MTIDIEEITLTAELCELPENIKIAIYNCLNDFYPYYNYAFKLKTKYKNKFIVKKCCIYYL
jgi:hypothetical protein